jgi:hypothetical protein
MCVVQLVNISDPRCVVRNNGMCNGNLLFRVPVLPWRYAPITASEAEAKGLKAETEKERVIVGGIVLDVTIEAGRPAMP